MLPDPHRSPRLQPRFDPDSLAWRLHLDAPLLAALLMVVLGGLVVLYSASDGNLDVVLRQSMRFAIGFGLMFVLAQVPPRSYRFSAPLVYLVGLTLLVMVLLFGTEAKGAQRWLTLPGFGRFQPAEVMKIAVPAMVAWYFRERALPARLRDVLVVMVIIAAPVLLIAKQPDLGTAILVAAAGFIVLFMAGLSWRLILSALAVLSAAAPAMYFFVMHGYQRRRVDTFLNPESDPQGAGWNIIQSKTAIGSGGMWGKGWLNGTQSRLDFLPESSTDFIFAVLGEELGFAGVVCLLAAYMFIISRGLIISHYAQDTFSRLLGASLALTFFIYVFVNIGMVSGLMPVVGVPLPLISYGGTSIVTLLAGFGVLMSIHTHRKLLGH